MVFFLYHKVIKDLLFFICNLSGKVLQMTQREFINRLMKLAAPCRFLSKNKKACLAFEGVEGLDQVSEDCSSGKHADCIKYQYRKASI